MSSLKSILSLIVYAVKWRSLKSFHRMAKWLSNRANVSTRARFVKSNKPVWLNYLCLMNTCMSVFWHKISSWMMKLLHALTNCSITRPWSKSAITVLKNLIFYSLTISIMVHTSPIHCARIRRWAVKKRWLKSIKWCVQVSHQHLIRLKNCLNQCFLTRTAMIYQMWVAWSSTVVWAGSMSPPMTLICSVNAVYWPTKTLST